MKYIIPIIILLIILVFSGNKLIGRKAADVIDHEIRKQIAASPQLKGLNYNDISVDPLAGKITFDSLSIRQGKITLSSSSAALNASLESLIGLLGDSEIEKIEDFDLSLKDFELDGEQHGVDLRLKELAVNLDAQKTTEGDLTLTINQIEDSVLKQIENAIGRKIARNAEGKILLELSDLEGSPELKILE